MHKAKCVFSTRFSCKYCFTGESFRLTSFLTSLVPSNCCLAVCLQAQKENPKFYAIWEWTLFTCYWKIIIIPTEEQRRGEEGGGRRKCEILCFNIMLETTINFHAWHTQKTSGTRRIFAFDNFIFFLSFPLPFLHISFKGKHWNDFT